MCTYNQHKSIKCHPNLHTKYLFELLRACCLLFKTSIFPLAFIGAFSRNDELSICKRRVLRTFSALYLGAAQSRVSARRLSREFNFGEFLATVWPFASYWSTHIFVNNLVVRFFKNSETSSNHSTSIVYYLIIHTK